MHGIPGRLIFWEPIHPCALEVKGNHKQLTTLHVVLEAHNEDPGGKSPFRLGSF